MKVYVKKQKRCMRSYDSSMKKSHHVFSTKARFIPSNHYKNSEQFKKKRGK